MKSWVVAAVLPLIAACSGDRGERAEHSQQVIAADATPSNETFVLGSELGSNGAVPRRAAGDAFSRGGEVYLSINVSSAGTDQQVKVDWVDDRGRVIRRQSGNVTKGARYVWFSSGPTARWARGPHRAVIVINGRTVSEKPFALM